MTNNTLISKLRNVFFSSLSAFLTSLSLWAQEDSAVFLQDTVLANGYFEHAEELTDSGKYYTAIKYYKKANHIYKRVQIWQKYIACQINIGGRLITLSIYDSAFIHTNNGLSKALEYFHQSPSILAECYNGMGILYRYKGDYEQAINFYKKALDNNYMAYGEEHPNVAISHNNLAICYGRKGNYDEEYNQLNKALNIHLNTFGELHTGTANVYDNIGIYYGHIGDHKNQLISYKRALNIRYKILDKTHPDFIYSYNNIATTLDNMGDYQQSISYCHKALSLANKVLGTKHISTGHIYYNLGVSHGSLGNYDKELIYLHKTLKVFIKLLGPEHYNLSYVYGNIATCYQNKGDYHKSILYHQKAITTSLLSITENHPEIAALYNNIGSCYKYINDHDKEFFYIKKALNIRLNSLHKNHPDIANSYNNLGNWYAERNLYEQALFYMEKALDIRKEIHSIFHPYTANTYANIASIYLDMKEYGKASTYTQTAIKIQTRIFGKKHPDISKSYRDMARLYLKQKEWKRVLNYCQLSLTSLINNFNDTNIYLNPLLKNMNSKIELLKTLELKANTLNKYYGINHKVQNLIHSYETYKLAIDLIDTLHQKYLTEQSDQNLNERSVHIYQKAIEVSNQLYNLNHDTKYAFKTFKLTEKSKAFTLSQALNESRAKQFAGLPDSLIEEEQNLKIDLAFYEEQLYKAKNKKDTARITMYQNYLFDRKVQYDSLIQHFEKKYPNYYQLKYDLQVASISDIRNYLPDTLTTFLEYTVADSAIFVFRIEKDTFQVYELPKPEGFEQKVEDFRKHVTEFGHFRFGTLKAQQRLFTAYVELGYELYQALLEPIVEAASLPLSMTVGEEKRRKLIIVPDGILGYLPFEALLTKRTATDPIDFRHLPYLIRDFQTAYAYSGTLLVNNRKEPEANPRKAARRFAGFAPVYESEPDTSEAYEPLSMMVRAGFTPLQHNKEEVQQISRLLGGHSYLGRAASEKSFKEKAADYQVLHLAMHSLIDDKDPLYSRLIFTQSADSLHQDSMNDNYLNAAELYNMQLNARLAVLSACETGYGQLIRGEGIMSLSRAFAYAGCPSLVMSLWNAEDQSTAQIMVDFYKQLRKEKTVDEALRQAKLRYLEEADHPYYQSHPFFWAAFVPVGEMETIPLYDYSWVWWGVPILLSVLILIALYKKRKKTTII